MCVVRTVSCPLSSRGLLVELEGADEASAMNVRDPLRLPFWWAVDAGLQFNFANYTIAITGSTSQEFFVSSGYLDVSSALF